MLPNYFEGNQVANYFSRNLEQFSGKKVSFLQIGAFAGDASAWLIENVLTHPESILVDVDTWEGSEEHFGLDFNAIESVYDQRIKSSEIVKKIKSTSDDFFKTNKRKFDFIYIDGDHTKEQVFKDGLNAIKVLKKNGIIAFDDYFHMPIREAIYDITSAKELTLIDSGNEQVWFRI